MLPAATRRTADKVGSQMRNFAEKLRDTGPRVESTIHSTAERLAEKLERGSAYFRERQYEGTTEKSPTIFGNTPESRCWSASPLDCCWRSNGVAITNLRTRGCYGT